MDSRPLPSPRVATHHAWGADGHRRRGPGGVKLGLALRQGGTVAQWEDVAYCFSPGGNRATGQQGTGWQGPTVDTCDEDDD